MKTNATPAGYQRHVHDWRPPHAKEQQCTCGASCTRVRVGGPIVDYCRPAPGMEPKRKENVTYEPVR